MSARFLILLLGAAIYSGIFAAAYLIFAGGLLNPRGKRTVSKLEAAIVIPVFFVITFLLLLLNNPL